MKMSWPPKGGLNFGAFWKNEKQLKYVENGSTRTLITLRAIPSRVINYLAKLTLHKPIFQSERVDNVYPDHVNALCGEGLAPSIFPTIGELRIFQDKKTDIDKESDLDVNKKKN